MSPTHPIYVYAMTLEISFLKGAFLLFHSWLGNLTPTQICETEISQLSLDI
jgi:hypothetical protein